MDQSPGAARERLLRAFPGRGVSEWRNGAFRKVSSEANGGSVSVEEEDSGVCGFAPMAVDAAAAPESSCSVFSSSSAENESSTKLESHSSSAISSYGTQSSPEN